MRALRLLALSGVLVVSAACGGDGTPPAGARPSSTATIDIIEPEQNASITTATMQVRVEITGGEIVEETSTNLTPDQGHVHVKVDGRVLTLNSGLEERVDTPEPGSHLLEVEFVASDHGPFSPRVLDTITFEVPG